MSEMMKILVATDYSEQVMNAEHYAVQLAKMQGFYLKFLHVFEPPIADQIGSFDAEKIDYSPVVHELKKLKEHVGRLMSSVGVKDGEIEYECLVREGHPAAQIVEEVNESFPDFVLMGTHGGSGFREFILGSQTWKVIKKAGVPVFAIPDDASFAGMKNIVFATEYREGELPVINFLTQLAIRFKAELTVLHITANVITEEFEKQISSLFKQELKNKIAYPGIKFKIEYATDIIGGLNQYTERNKSDLLVMSPEKPYFLERVFSPGSRTTKTMSIHTKLPLLAIPDYYNPDFVWFWKLFTMDYTMEIGSPEKERIE